jgi:serine/threonine protein kinase
MEMIFMTKQKKPHDLYEILEVSPRARTAVINAAYKTLMQEYHPDKNNGNDTYAKDINYAKSILLDPQKKAEYDKDRQDLTGKVIGNYRILELIAEGGFGKTYKGEQVHLGTPVCIKHANYLSALDEQILLEEAKAIWDLRHFGIPTIRDILKLDDGSHALVMSYIPGPTLEKIIKKVKKLDPEHVAWIAERSLNVLKYLHYNGVVHGDVKPQNIIIQPDNHTVVLVDYGLSLIRPSADTSSKGYTPYFASPEQKAGSPLVPETDFYGLGMTMIYALGGDIETKRVPSNVPDPMCKFIKKLLTFDVLSRPNWETEDLMESIQEMRQKSFGRKYSGLKAIPGL